MKASVPGLAAVRAVGLAALSAGLIFAAIEWPAARRRAAAARRKLGDLEAVRRLQAESERWAAARDLWEELDSPTLTPLDQLTRRLLGDTAAPEIVERDAETVLGGWRLRRVALVFHEAPLDAVGRLVAAAAAARPPWRLAEFRATAAASARGYGRATLVFEGLERAEAAP